MSESQIKFSKSGLKSLIEMERVWIRKVFPENSVSEDVGIWDVPNTPYSVEWLLWHLSESHNWVRNAVLGMRKKDGKPIGYAKFKSKEFKVDERIEIFLKESKKLQEKVESISEEELNEMTTHLSMFGEQTVPLAQIVYEDIYHVIGHMNVISYIKGLKGRMSGEKQKWPPY
ncbi:MAG: hypothetical protein ACTSUV_02160 [Candidatus Ranarchaeia archaeon]